MYAIIETGGKQYKVAEGDSIPVDRLDLPKDSAVKFDKVLLVGGDNLSIGQPYVSGASVSAKVLDEQKDEKVITIKFKPKTGYKRTKNHRQTYSIVKIEKINK